MWFGRRRYDDFQAEIRSHVELETDRLMAEGMPAAEAAAAARRRFGNVAIAQERFYESQRTLWLEQLWQDARYGLRALGKARAFTAAAVLTIALGVGANTAVFSLIDAVLLRTLPVADPQSLVFLEMAGQKGPSGAPPYPCFRRLREETKSFAGLAAFSSDELRVEIDGRPEQVMGQVASGNYFELLGLRPAAGRLMSAADEKLDPPVAVISERYWQRRFGGGADAIGKTIRFRDKAYAIIGVTPEGFYGLRPGTVVDLTLPISVEAPLLHDASAVWLQGVIGRLRPGVSISQAQAEGDVVFRSFMAGARYPADIVAQHFHHLEAVTAAHGLAGLRRRFSQPLQVLMGIAGLVLLLAVANIANLLLSRGLSRGHEFAVRLAAGAGRGRIVRQLLTETALLFLLGAIPGVLLAEWGVGLIGQLFQEGRRAIEIDAGLNWRVLVFSFAIAMGAGLIAGLVPAWRAFRTDSENAMSDGQARTGESRGAGRVAQTLVVFQVGLSLVLLVGAALFAVTLASLRERDAGFRGDDVLTMSIAVPDDTAVPWVRALEAVQAIPGVRSAAISNYTPLSGRDRGALVRVAGYAPATAEDATVHTNQVSEEYFATMGIPLVRGRLLTAQDTEGAAPVVLINEAAARTFFGDRDPVGQPMAFPRKGGETVYRVAGVVGNTRHMNLRDPFPRFAYIPIRQPKDLEHRMTLSIATAMAGVDGAVRNALAVADSRLLISDVITMRRQVDSTLLSERLLSGLSTAFGALAMLLAVVGLYGVLSYRVGRQRRAIGIRMALGATPGSVAAGVLWQSVRVIAVGVLAGLPFAFAAARMANNLLWGARADSPLPYLACAGVLTAAGLASAYFPARRAARVDPAEALRG